MRRREFISLVGGAAAWPLAALAQQSAMPVIGFLRSTTASSATHLVTAFRQGLEKAGFVEGQNVAIEYRWADDQIERIPVLAAELVHRPVTVIVGSFIVAKAAMELTSTIPIVFVAGIDPVRAGLVPSLNRPDGNVTGVVFDTVELAGKRLALLYEFVPAKLIAVLLDANFPGVETEERDAQRAGSALGRQIFITKINSEQDLAPAFIKSVEAGAGALLVGSGPFMVGHRSQLVALASRHSLPASYVARDFVEIGGLMSYGPSQTDAYRRGAVYVARILNGEKPNSLPVELPTKFDMVINLVTAKALGLEVPPMLLARADEVIE